jgi:hypothetical protein
MNYTSSVRLLGLPLIDVRVGVPPAPGVTRSVARGWIAVGDLAFGGFLSLGGIAVGGIAIGGLAVGVVPIGGLAAGLLALGGAAFGVWSVGGAAFGLHAALGGLAIAASYAQGGLAIARHANDADAVAFFSTGPVFPAVRACLPYTRWLVLLPVLFLPFFLRRRPGA